MLADVVTRVMADAVMADVVTRVMADAVTRVMAAITLLVVQCFGMVHGVCDLTD